MNVCSESSSPWGRVDSEELAARFKRHELLELGEVSRRACRDTLMVTCARVWSHFDAFSRYI